MIKNPIFALSNSVIMDERLQAFKRLLDIMDAVRAGCPWDSTQTIQSLRHLTIEETYELSQAILNDDLNEVKKELGDLMLHIVFYAKIGQEKGAFDIADVLNGICDKMIVRHPHIFGTGAELGENQVGARAQPKRFGGCARGVAFIAEGLPYAPKNCWRGLPLA